MDRELFGTGIVAIWRCAGAGSRAEGGGGVDPGGMIQLTGARSWRLDGAATD